MQIVFISALLSRWVSLTLLLNELVSGAVSEGVSICASEGTINPRIAVDASLRSRNVWMQAQSYREAKSAENK